ncbi:class 1 isoprenoid biosynthesis enzyme [Desulforhopalus sp. IMCC35007]|uniref:class 1 isoprenoid biosynthesis enzyme n=1 Tax=Desulforhopalus sp. IMCC35007 TaxID=2569543 RepID=UPI0010AE37FE|nr:class 1 isoprenoid biosynthesis enzyme [Desulforhopalus sp. IMCC35007]TKB07485.1 hypothetical protein FCL48_17245 [Desulforhopalus sp. IMCC35007]
MKKTSPSAVSFAASPLPEPLEMLAAELEEGLQCYWQNAAAIMEGSSVQLIEPDRITFSLQRNFFSTLFMYSYYRAGISKDRRILYAAVNQCLRGMVTGCDNILDDEYKKTLETDLPAGAYRFRSVLDIMVSDRALVHILLDYCLTRKLPIEKLVQASTASLHALLQSGAQEASEEGGVEERLLPEEILNKIHHFKTGVLFKCTWAIPAVFEETVIPAAMAVQDALYNIGMGCQILDDMVDLFRDVMEQRHNYVASVIFHEESAEVWQQLETSLKSSASPEHFYADFPELAMRMKTKALQFLDSGLRNLFHDHDLYLLEPATNFIAGRIGVQL